MGILKTLFIIVLVGIIGGNVLRLQVATDVAVTLLDIAVGGYVLTWLCWRIATKRPWNKYVLAKPLLVFSTVALISLVINSVWLGDRVYVALLYFVRWMIYAGVYFAVQDFPSTFHTTIKKLLLWVSGILVVLGFIQYLFYSNLRNIFYLGWDEHMARLFSSFLDPNFAGAILVLGSIMYLANILHAKDTSRKWMLIIVYTLLVIGIVLTFSRTALVMMLVGTSMLLVLFKKTRWLLGVFFIAVVTFLVLSRNFETVNMNLLRTFSIIERLESMQRAVVIAQRSPVIGVGFGAYRYAQIEAGYIPETTQFPSHADASTDNSLLFVVATTGIIGLIAYGYLLQKIWQMRKQTNNIVLSYTLSVSLIALLIGSFFNNLLFYSFIMIWIWILVGLTENT